MEVHCLPSVICDIDLMSSFCQDGFDNLLVGRRVLGEQDAECPRSCLNPFSNFADIGHALEDRDDCIEHIGLRNRLLQKTVNGDVLTSFTKGLTIR